MSGRYSGIGGVYSSSVVTFADRMVVVLRARVVTNPGRVASTITLVSAVGAAVAPSAQLLFLCLKHEAVRVMRSKLKTFVKGARQN